MHIPRTFYRWCWLPLYRRFVLWYVQKERFWRYGDLTLQVPPGVFHPGLYLSTPIMLDFLSRQSLGGLKVLDMGTGSGALALRAAQMGADVCAADIHPDATATARANADRAKLPLTVVQSDLFSAIPAQCFDVILANPPYYPKNAENMAEYAFFAGEGLDYFQRFFGEATRFCHSGTQIWMVLSEDCRIQVIHECAHKAGFGSKTVAEQYHWGERLFIEVFCPDQLFSNQINCPD